MEISVRFLFYIDYRPYSENANDPYNIFFNSLGSTRKST
jgi:hypothetical protein